MKLDKHISYCPCCTTTWILTQSPKVHCANKIFRIKINSKYNNIDYADDIVRLLNLRKELEQLVNTIDSDSGMFRSMRNVVAQGNYEDIVDIKDHE